MIGPTPSDPPRRARSAALRNRHILDRADKLFLGALNPAGQLKALTPLPPHLYKCGGKGRTEKIAVIQEEQACRETFTVSHIQ